jgi:hypothetical protein
VAKEEIHQHQIPIFKTILTKREIYAQSADGLGVIERYEREVQAADKKKIRPAHLEMANLYKEVLNLIEGK